MPSEPYEIDDNKSAEENLAVFAGLLKEADTELGQILSDSLGDLSLGKNVSVPHLLDSLFHATAPEEGTGQ